MENIGKTERRDLYHELGKSLKDTDDIYDMQQLLWGDLIYELKNKVQMEIRASIMKNKPWYKKVDE